jgi:hypothetical protein
MTDGESSQVPGSAPSAETAEQRAQATGNGAKVPEDMSVGELVFEVSDRASGLIREEIELAKTEVTEKVNRLLRGSVAGLAAGIFVVLALFLLMHGFAWLLNDLVFNNFWAGFFVEAGIFLLIGAAADPRHGDRGGQGDQGRLRRGGASVSTPAGRTIQTRGNGRWSPPPPGTRTAEQIRQDIVQQRQELSRSVDALRNRWVQVTDVKRQISEHRTELAVGAAVVGFVVGLVALRRRR